MWCFPWASQPFSLHSVQLWVSISVDVLSSVLAVLFAASLICKKDVTGSQKEGEGRCIVAS